MSLFDLQMWIIYYPRIYEMYIGHNTPDLIGHLSTEDRMNFVLLVWHSEGCPEI